MATDIVVPNLGESVKQAILIKWHKADGEAVKVDEPVCELETDKANTDIPAQVAGVIRRVKNEGDTVMVGEVIGRIDEGGKAAAKAPAATQATATQAGKTESKPGPRAGAVALEDYSPAVRKLIDENKLDPKSIKATGPNNRLTAEDVQGFLAKNNGKERGADQIDEEPTPTAPPEAAPQKRIEKPKDVATVSPAVKTPNIIAYDSTGIHRAPISKMRDRIAKMLVQAQHTAAILTTFNEVDVTAIIELRTKYKERFQEVHGVGLGFMSFFARAVILALKEFPRINAFIEDTEVVYHQYVNLGIAVSTDRGLAVPVLRNAEKMSFARIEAEIKRVAGAIRDGKLSLEELSGGTFTITNGGVFGSLLSTPIINPPQSGILGMHAIQKRPMVVNDKIEIRSMMYVALSYDHRLVDGRESVSFLVRLKQYLEDPARLMLEI